MGQKKKWSSSAKFEIALQAVKGDNTIAEICQRYQVAPSQVHAWKKELLEKGSQLFIKGNTAAQKETKEQELHQRRLLEKIGQLTIEKDFLKKSVDSFPWSGEDD